MQSESVRAFKNELRNYSYYLSRAATLSASIDFLYDRLGGVRGVDPSKEPIHSPPNKEMEYQLREQIEALTQKKEAVAAKIKSIEQILARMETSLREAVIEVYVYNYKCVAVADRMYLSSTGLQKRMNKAIEKALNES